MKTCGECAYGFPARGPDNTIDFTKRTCYGMPPTPILVPGPKGAQIVGIRNTVEQSDHGCSLHKEKKALTGFDAHA